MTPMEWTVKQLESFAEEVVLERQRGLMQRVVDLREEAGFWYGEELG